MGVMILTVLHYGLCFGLILIILLQAGKGGGLASAFGGGSSETIFGTRRGNILTRITAIGVSIFMVTSLLLTIILPRQISVIQKKGVIGEEQMRDVKRPQIPGMPTGVPPAGQQTPIAPPAEAPVTPPAPPVPKTPQPPQAPVTQPPAGLGETPATPEGAKE